MVIEAVEIKENKIVVKEWQQTPYEISIKTGKSL